MRSLYIEFDGRQVVVRTNVREAYDALAHVHSPLRADRATDVVGEVVVESVAGGYTVTGAMGDRHTVSVQEAVTLARYDIVRLTAGSRRDLFWLHAGAVERDGVALLLPAPGGSGKSTLVTLLCEMGWRLMADDMVALEMHRDVAVPYPQVPARRVGPGYEVPWPDSLNLPKRFASLAPGSYTRERVTVGAVVFPSFRYGAPCEVVRQRTGNGALELLRSCMNFDDHRDGAVARAAHLAATVPMYGLTYGAAGPAAQLLDRPGDLAKIAVAAATASAAPLQVA